MNLFKFDIHPEKCVGCRICQLTCSFIYTKKYSHAHSRIKIKEIYGLYPKIEFTENCTNCGQCAKYCLYGAIEFKEVKTS